MAANPKIGWLGEPLDLEIRQGATFGPHNAAMVNPDNSPVDLTGCVIRGQIRRTALTTTVTASLSCTITDPAGGLYTLSMTDEVTAAIPAGESITDPKSKYVWDLELEDSQGRVIPLYYGNVSVLRESTRA